MRVAQRSLDADSDSVSRGRDNESLELFGTLGCLRRGQGTSTMSFELQPLDDSRYIQRNKLLLKDLFMLAAGCLPFPGEAKYLRIASELESDDDHSVVSLDSDNEQSIRPRRRPYDQVYNYPQMPTNRRSSAESPLRSCKAFELVHIEDLDQVLTEMAGAFRADCSDIWQFRQVALTEKLMSSLTGCIEMSYVPADASWIRLKLKVKFRSLVRERSPIACPYFIKRADAQMLACSLLQLQWHPEGYLLGAENGALGYQSLINTAHRLVPMVSRLFHRLDYLSLASSEAERLADCLNMALKILKKGNKEPTRSLSGVLFRLDVELGRICARESQAINVLIGVLMMTNLEFNSIVYHSLRRLPATVHTTANATIFLSDAATIETVSALGVRQTFVVDLAKIYPQYERKPEPVVIIYSTIILAATKACLRSTMLMNCFDARPLIEAVESMDDVIHVQ